MPKRDFVHAGDGGGGQRPDSWSRAFYILAAKAEEVPKTSRETAIGVSEVIFSATAA